ncbi:galactan beta-1,4-galactosyltransferase GALS3-like [Aristolochia californica]|uniref:galactan beta-1,4-galactosyltransferase GALS3-like n=1 Tax=Aristolochia californica TaxID=171875 RepID=UPI0035E23883
MATERDKERKMFVGVVWYCAEMKFLLTFFFLVCSLITLLQFIPSRLALSPLNLRLCLSNLSNLSSPVAAAPSATEDPVLPVPTTQQRESVTETGVIKRAFIPYGAAAYLFVQMGAYRGGLNTFAITGLASKPLHVYGRPLFECKWVPENTTHPTASANGTRILPDWGYGRVYTVVVVNCTFSTDVGSDRSGGKLLLIASSGGKHPDDIRTEEIVALIEKPGSLNPAIFTSKPTYDYLYCGSSLYGNLSPQRIREWIAYHVKLFGRRSHFVIHDAGGVHREVMEVLQPWIEKGFVTLQDIREQERFDGYYHNQFMVVNDCLHRYRFVAKWMFFFDVDEFVYVPRKSTIDSVVSSLSSYSQFTIEQMPMSGKLCSADDKGRTPRMWVMEKMVYRDVKRGIRRDRKYAIQPRKVFATGVHMSQNVVGRTQHKTYRQIMYFHYHGTISYRRDPCSEFINTTKLTYEGVPYVLDQTLRGTAALVKRFELKTIGTRLQRTRQ